MKGRNEQSGRAEIATDPAAFEAFYRLHVDAVTRFLACRVDDPLLVADLVAEVFVAVLDSAHTYRSASGSELGWLYGVARNVLSAERRRAIRQERQMRRISGSHGGLVMMTSEDRLLAELKAKLNAEAAVRAETQAERPRRLVTGRRLVAAATITGAATAVVAVPVVAGSRSPAYAVTKNADGSITVTINEFKNPAGLEAALARLGVRANISYHRTNLNKYLNCSGVGLPKPEQSPPVRAWKEPAGKKSGPPAQISTWLADFGDKTFKIYPQRIKPGKTIIIRVDENTAGRGMWVGSGPPLACH